MMMMMVIIMMMKMDNFMNQVKMKRMD
jgi:hypothetical protein